MRRLLILIFTLILSVTTFAPNIYSSNKIESNKNTLKQAKLIENHIVSYKSKIEDLENKYEIVNSIILKENYDELEKLIWALKKIETENVNSELGNKIIKEVVRKLKIINDNLKLYIKLKKEEYDKKFNKSFIAYSNIAIKLSSSIKLLIKKMVVILKEKEKITEKHKIIIRHLASLEKESKVLDNFNKYDYNSIEEIKFNLSQSIKNIKKDLKEIKNTLEK